MLRLRNSSVLCITFARTGNFVLDEPSYVKTVTDFAIRHIHAKYTVEQSARI